MVKELECLLSLPDWQTARPRCLLWLSTSLQALCFPAFHLCPRITHPPVFDSLSFGSGRLSVPVDCKQLSNRVLGVSDSRDGGREARTIPCQKARRCGILPSSSLYYSLTTTSRSYVCKSDYAIRYSWRWEILTLQYAFLVSLSASFKYLTCNCLTAIGTYRRHSSRARGSIPVPNLSRKHPAVCNLQITTETNM